MKEIVYLVGLPASGKTTYRKARFSGYAVVSNDEVTEEYAARNGLTYDQAWAKLSAEDVEQEGRKRFEKAVQEGCNIVIDNTNLTPATRAAYRAEGYAVKAVLFLPDETLRQEREQARKNEGGKYISAAVVEKMRKSFVMPCETEGFSEIIRVG